MNAAGRAVLGRAALEGVPQAFGCGTDGSAHCALWLLVFSLPRRRRYVAAAARAYGLRRALVACPECGALGDSEVGLLMHLNDAHRFGFLKIAEVMPVAGTA